MVPALTSFPGCLPEKMGGVGNALLQYIYLNLYIGSHLSKKRHKGGLGRVNWELTEMAKLLTDNWQIAKNLTDLLSFALGFTDKGLKDLIVLFFLQNPFLRP